MILLKTVAGGILLPVYAQPGARKNSVIGEHAGRLKVAVTAPPEKGKANEAILGVLAEALRLRHSQLSIVRGQTSRQKDVQVTGIDEDDLQERIALLKLA